MRKSFNFKEFINSSIHQFLMDNINRAIQSVSHYNSCITWKIPNHQLKAICVSRTTFSGEKDVWAALYITNWWLLFLLCPFFVLVGENGTCFRSFFSRSCPKLKLLFLLEIKTWDVLREERPNLWMYIFNDLKHVII